MEADRRFWMKGSGIDRDFDIGRGLLSRFSTKIPAYPLSFEYVRDKGGLVVVVGISSSSMVCDGCEKVLWNDLAGSSGEARTTVGIEFMAENVDRDVL